MGLGVRILSSFKRNCQQRNGEFDHFNYKVFDAPVEREDQSTGNEKAAVARTVNKIPCSPRLLTTEGALDVEFEPKIRGA